MTAARRPAGSAERAASRVDALAHGLAVLGGLGYLRPAPGTWASAAAAVVLALGWERMPVLGWWLATTAVSALGYWAVARHVRHRGEHDPAEVVVDELAGMLAAAAVASQGGLGGAVRVGAAALEVPALPGIGREGTIAVCLFLAFRAFDILKPWPIGLVDRRLRSAMGAMLDDLLAGLAAGTAVLLLVRMFA